MHHGVAIASRVPMREDDRLDWQANGEARHVGVRLDCGVRLENVYVPAGRRHPGPRAQPQIRPEARFRRADDALVGELRLPDDHGRRFQRRAARMRRLEPQAVAQRRQPHAGRGRGADPAAGAATTGSISAAISIPAPQRLHTWWSYRSPDWTKNDRGRRLDHMWATADVAKQARAHKVYEPCRNWTRPSDHVPLMTEFAL